MTSKKLRKESVTLDKVEVIARRVLGWSLNSPKKWYSVEEATFIENFDPTENLNDAMRIVRKFEELGFTFSKQGDTKVCFGNQFIKECGITNSRIDAYQHVLRIPGDGHDTSDIRRENFGNEVRNRIQG